MASIAFATARMGSKTDNQVMVMVSLRNKDSGELGSKERAPDLVPLDNDAGDAEAQ